MLNKRQIWCLVGAVSMGVAIATSALFLTGLLNHVLPGQTISLAELRSFYPVDFRPLRVPAAISIFGCYFYLMAAEFYLFTLEKKWIVFPNPTYHIGLIGFSMSSLSFTLFAVYSVPSSCFFSVVAMATFASISLFCAVRRRSELTDEGEVKLDDSSKYWFERIVVDAAAFSAAWYNFFSLPFFGTTSLAYEDGFHNTGVLRGWYSLQTCGTVSLMYAFVFLLCWIVIDCYLFPHLTKFVGAMYPHFLYISVIVSAGGDFTNNRKLYAICCVVVIVFWVKRLKQHSAEKKKGN